MLRLPGGVLGGPDLAHGARRMVVNALGRTDPKQATCTPATERPKLVRVARAGVAIHAATTASAPWSGSILPLLAIWGPRACGAWRHILTGVLRHGGRPATSSTTG